MLTIFNQVSGTPPLGLELGAERSATASDLGQQFVDSPAFAILVYVVTGLLALTLTFFLIRHLLLKVAKAGVPFRQHILLITVPKEGAEDSHGQPKEIPQQIAPAEVLFSILGGLHAPRWYETLFRPRHDTFAFEIVASHGLISFYAAVPDDQHEFFVEQLHAQYPSAQIEPVTDYNMFTPQGTILAANLMFAKPYIFPIRTYLKIETDPLNAITNAMSRVPADEGAAIQYVMRSAHPSWHSWGSRVARDAQQGKKLKEALHGKSWYRGWLGSTRKKPKPGEPYVPEEVYRLSPMEEEQVKMIEEKASKAGFEVNIRVVVSSLTKVRAEANLKSILSAFGQYSTYEYGNSLKAKSVGDKKLIDDFIYRRFHRDSQLILNTEEMTSLFHLPLPSTETPNINWLLAKRAAPPANLPNEGIVLGKSIFRGTEIPVRIKPGDRRRHVYIVGKSGVGKSQLLASMAIQDITAGQGVCVIDPHGDLVDAILARVPKERIDDVVYFDPSDVNRPIGLNMLEVDSPEERDFAVQEMIAIFYKLFPPEMIGPMFEHNMRNVMLTLMEDEQYPGTITDIPRMFTDPVFQKYKVAKVKDHVVRAFWEKEMAKTSDFHKSEMLGYLISKVGRFVENEMMRNIIGQPRSGFNVRQIMDEKKVLLVNLSKGKTGEVNSSLLGLILVSKIQLAALSRADLPEEQRSDFYLYIDEFQNFITDSIATILSEARKYRLNLIIAHQYMGQLIQNNDPKIRDAVLGNAGTMMAFKIGVDDAEVLAKEFAPVFNEYDLINIEKYNAYIRLLIDNQASRAFNMQTMLLPTGDTARAERIKELSRLRYGKDRSAVTAEILERSQLGAAIATAPPPAVGGVLR